MCEVVVAIYRVRLNQPLDPAIAVDWSMTHSPTPRYRSTQVLISLFSLDARSVWKLAL